MRATALVIAMNLSFSTMAAAPSTPQMLANEALGKFAAGQTGTFVPGLARVLRQDGDRATLLLSGYPKTVNSGEGVMLSRAFAGIYDARREEGEWKLGALHRIDEFNQIELQRLHVQVIPGASLRVTDEMRIDVGAPYGFVARLNPKARIESVRWNGRPSRFAFGGALLWVPVRQHKRGKLTIRYRIDGIEDFATARGADVPSARDLKSGRDVRSPLLGGHVRDRYFWHPFFDFDSANDRATFVVDVTIPRAFELTTSLPQHERIDGPNRIILAASESPTMALTLAYARDWQGWNMDAGGFTVQLFTSKDFSPPPAEVLSIYRQTVQLLRERFDVPPVAYFGLAQIKSMAGSGAHFSSNSVVFTNDDDARAFLSREIARRYVFGTGPGTDLLQDGWATYVESLCLRTPASHASIFHKLESALGQPRFDRAMRRFIHNCASKPQSMEDFLALMQSEAPPDLDVAALLNR